MDINKIPKNQWTRNDGKNIGHNEFEWGKIKDSEKLQIIAYDVKWGENKKNKCITCGQSYKFIGSKFCSKKCYKNYFVPKFD